jgi:tRNA threonylcarbamoyladenosine biosynthesis protein TsaE
VVEGGHVVFSGSGIKLDGMLRCGGRLGRALQPGDLVFLEGPLGAGKTTFVRAVAEALEVTDPVRSPSFTIANIYSGRLTVQHLDLYRLSELASEDALALEEYVCADAVTLVEWPETGEALLGPPAWRVSIGHESVSTRNLEIRAFNEGGRLLWEEAGGDG